LLGCGYQEMSKVTKIGAYFSLSTLILFSAGYPHINWNSNSQSLRSLSVSQKGVFCANFVGSCQNQSEVLMKLVIEKKGGGINLKPLAVKKKV